MGQPVIHWQIITKNPDKVTDFYTRLFGWKVDANNPLGYRMIDTDSGKGINGGVWPAPPEAHSFLQFHVEVDDVPAYVAKATGMGAKVIVPPQKLPAGDEMAVLHDPEGLSFVVVQPGQRGS